MGLGIGFMPIFQAHMNSDLHEVLPPQSDWYMPLWLVTHVDVHRTAKVQAISKVLLDSIADQITITNSIKKQNQSEPTPPQKHR